jgi:hypothetical protein
MVACRAVVHLRMICLGHVVTGVLIGRFLRLMLRMVLGLLLR